MDEIPRETALKFCREIREENLSRRFSMARMQCWGCTRYAKGDPNKLCLASQAGNRGCSLVNKRYEQLKQGPSPS
jgi:hypothetical protein